MHFFMQNQDRKHTCSVWGECLSISAESALNVYLAQVHSLNCNDAILSPGILSPLLNSVMQMATWNLESDLSPSKPKV